MWKILKFTDGKSKISRNNCQIRIKVLRLNLKKMDDSELRGTFTNLDEHEHEIELSSMFRTFEP